MENKIILSLLSRLTNFKKQSYKSVIIHQNNPGTISKYIDTQDYNAIENLSISGLIDTRDLDFIKNMKNLKRIDLSKSKITAYVEYEVDVLPRDAFYGCKKIEEILLPESLVYISSLAFFKCRSLKHITIPARVKSIGYLAFHLCRNLQEIKLPDQLNYIGFLGFSGCKNLSSIEMSSSKLLELEHDTCVFYQVPVKTCLLKVGIGLKDNFSNAHQWGQFSNIQEFGLKAN